MVGTNRHAHSFRDLIVYQKSRSVACTIFDLSQRFPKEEIYSLTNQIRRSSRSIGAQIAEAWGKRRYARHFVSKLTDADYEQLETQHWIDVCVDCSYLNQTEASSILQELEAIGKMLNSMIVKANSFCGEAPYVSESHDEYFTADRPITNY